jgi:hypothetical protein
VLVGESAAAWRATVGQREDDEALQAAEGVPDGLVGIAHVRENRTRLYSYSVQTGEARPSGRSVPTPIDSQ